MVNDEAEDYYQIADHKGYAMSWKEIGELEGITAERARQIGTGALKKLRKRLAALGKKTIND